MSLDDILQEVKNIPDDELVGIMDDLKEWSNVGVTVEEFINYKKALKQKQDGSTLQHFI